MLVWKVIAANPGITRAGIWERIEHSIPEGYALRLYDRCEKPTAVTPAVGLKRARGFVLTTTLTHLRNSNAVAWSGNKADRRYVAARKPIYYGNPDAIDESGSKAADHMAVADALRTVDRLLAKADSRKVSDAVRRSRGALTYIGFSDIDAIRVLAEAVRAKRPDA